MPSNVSLYGSSATNGNVTSNNFTTLYSPSAGVVRTQLPYGNSNVVSLLNIGTDGGNTVTNIIANGNVTAQNFIGNFIGNSTNANYANYAGQAFNVSGSNVTGDVAGANHANIADVANSVSVANVIGIGNIAVINLDGNVSNILHGNGYWGPESGNLNANFANYAGNVTNSAQPNITSVGTLTGLSSNGTVNFSNAANVNLGSNSNVHISGGSANYALITDGAGNLSWGQVANALVANFANYAGNVTNSAQPNITSVGALTGLSSNGTVNFANAANVNLGSNSNVHISGGAANYALITDGAGNLSWGQVANASNANYANYAGNLINGTSNVNTNGANGNISISVNGVSNVATFQNNSINLNYAINTPNTVIIGNSSGNTGYADTRGDISIGYQSGTGTHQLDPTIAIGYQAGNVGQKQGSISIGYQAGRNQNDAAVAIGYQAGETQSAFAVAIGVQSGQITQGSGAIAIGSSAASNNQSQDSIAIGSYAGWQIQGRNSIAIGAFAGFNNQANNSIILNATGSNLNQTTANTFTVKPVRNANTSNVLFYNNTTGEITYDLFTGNSNVDANFANFAGNVTVSSQPNITSVGNLIDLRINNNSIHLGTNTAVTTPAANSVAIGYQAGATGNSSATRTVAIGFNTANTNQGDSAVAIGRASGQLNQGANSVAIGFSSAGNGQGIGAIAIGTTAGNTLQGNSGIAIGTNAGRLNQGIASIAIGVGAGYTNQANNSIILNATGSNLDFTTVNSFVVKPVRNVLTGNAMFYDNTTGEISYDVLSNVTVGNANIANFANYAGNVTVSAQANITTLGNLLNLTIANSSNTTGFISQYNPNSISIVTNATNHESFNVTTAYSNNSVNSIVRVNGTSSSPTTAIVGDLIRSQRAYFYNGTTNALGYVQNITLSNLNTNTNAYTTGTTWALAVGNPVGDQGNASANSGLNNLLYDQHGTLTLQQGAAPAGSGINWQLLLAGYGGSSGNTNNAVSGMLMRRARGNRDANITVEPNDQLGRVVFQGYNGNAYATNRVAMVRAVVDSTYVGGNANIPIGMQFITCDNTSSYTHNMYANGNVQLSQSLTVGNALSVTGKTDLNGNVQLSTSNIFAYKASSNNIATFYADSGYGWDINVTGNGYFTKGLAVDGNLTVGGTFYPSNLSVANTFFNGNFTQPFTANTGAKLWGNVETGGNITFGKANGNLSEARSVTLADGNIFMTITDGNLNVLNSSGNGGWVNAVNLSTTSNANISGNINLTGRMINYDYVYGSWYNNSTITPASANTAYSLPIGTLNVGSDISVASTSQITFAKAGKFNLQFSLQAINSDNATEHDFWVWLSKNGSDVADTATNYTVIKNNGKNVAALNFIIEPAVNDYYELKYAVASANITFPTYASQSSPWVMPAIPSLITTVVPVGA